MVTLGETTQHSITRRQFATLLSAAILLPALHPKPAAAAATPSSPVRIGLIDLDPSRTLARSRERLTVRQMTFWQSGYREARTQGPNARRRHADMVAHAVVDTFQRLAPGRELVLYLATPILEQPDGTQVIDLDQLAFAYDWMASQGVRIVAQTFVGRDTSQLRAAMARAAAHDLIVVSSAGNGPDWNVTPPFPAAYGSTIAITTTGLRGALAAEDEVLRKNGLPMGRAAFVDYAVPAPSHGPSRLRDDPERASEEGSSRVTGVAAGILGALAADDRLVNQTAARALLDGYAMPSSNHELWGRGVLDPEVIANRINAGDGESEEA